MSRNNNHIDQLTPEILRAYHAGELSNAQQHRVEKLMLDDPFYAEALEGLEELSAKQLTSDLDQLGHKLFEAQNETQRFPWYRLIAATIVLIIIAGAFFLNKEEEPVEKPTQEIVPFRAPPANKQALEDAPVLDPKGTKLSDSTLLPPISSEEHLNAGINKEQSEEALDLELKIEDQVSEESILFEEEPNEVVAISEVEINVPMSNFEFEIDSLQRSLNLKLEKPTATRSSKAGLNTQVLPVLRGRVIGTDDSLGLPQVTVLIKGTTNGVLTDMTGRFLLPMQENQSDIIVFRYLGYLSKEVEVGTKTELLVTLEPDTQALGEVVVTSYGTAAKKAKIINAMARPTEGFQRFNKYLKDNIRYPNQHKGSKIKGRVTVVFDITAEGQITNLSIVEGLGEDFDQEAIRLIENGPSWEPATNEQGEPIHSEMKVRIRFKE